MTHKAYLPILVTQKSKFYHFTSPSPRAANELAEFLQRRQVCGLDTKVRKKIPNSKGSIVFFSPEMTALGPSYLTKKTIYTMMGQTTQLIIKENR